MNEGNAQTCPVCNLNDDQIVHKGSGLLARRIECPRCKEFIILDLIEFTAPDLFFGPKLSAWIRDRNERHAEVPKLTTATLEDLKKGLRNYGPREKQIILLQNIERKTAYPGKSVEIIPKYDIPLAWASSEEEFHYYINSLIERGFLKKRGHAGPITRFSDMLFSVIITADGWDYLEQHERRIEERTQAFVAMSFKDDLKAIWKGPIFNAITKAGYKPYRGDEEPHIGLIDVKIISEIKNSRFVVADFTYQNRGVYFETGYAQGMGLPVIRCVKEDDFEKLHFDKNHYNFIIWKTPSDLEGQLYNYICAIIGKGKEA
jgi:hypothetical protein